MGAPKRSRAQRQRDLDQISALYLKGWRQVDIAEEIGVTQQQIAYDLKEIHARWRESSVRNLDEAKAMELARLDELEREYWAAWERSKGEKTKARQFGKMDADGQRQIERAVMEKEQLIGNPAFLAGVEKCIDMRCKLLGIYAPTRLDAWMRNLDLGKLSLEQLDRIAKGEDPVQVILSDYVHSDTGGG